MDNNDNGDFIMTCNKCEMTHRTEFNPPKPMSRADRISWCIIFTKQSLRDCGLFNWLSRRKLKSELRIYESGRFPGEVVE